MSVLAMGLNFAVTQRKFPVDFTTLESAIVHSNLRVGESKKLSNCVCSNLLPTKLTKPNLTEE